MKKLLIAFFSGIAIAALPGLLAGLPAKSGLIPAIQQKTNYLLTPGAIVAVAASGGHDVSFSALLILNVLFYCIVIYFALALAERMATSKRTRDN